MPQASSPSAVIRNERTLSASPRAVFAAFENPQRLAEWWGPNGFRNTFEQFDFKPGGRWAFVMHGPNGADYANESRFGAIEPNAMIVIEHVSAPQFTLTVTLTARDDKTHLVWAQDFINPEMAERMRPLCETANEQNLDRLEALLAKEHS